MYERNAIVLERYFYRIFNFRDSSNLRENYKNYRKLFECYGVLVDTKEKEEFCRNEFDKASQEISDLQDNQEKLYKKNAKYEYSRYIIFNNIKESVENIEKYLNKVNNDIQKNNEELKILGEKFTQAVDDYNQKNYNLKEAINAREQAQIEYDRAYNDAEKCYHEITEEMIEYAKEFIESDNKDIKKELQEIFDENGKNERNPFDTDVILNTINKSIEIYKLEMDTYLMGLDRISKLFEEIEGNSVKVDKHTKYYRDSKAKLDFLNAEKEYIVQFLDNERIGAIYDKKAHRKLMLEACKKFVLDVSQIEKLYDIILKETAGRSTKKIYKENYNKEYLVDLEDMSTEPSLDTGKMRQDAIALVNLNYWRVEGMKSVYNAFENVVTTIYEKDLSEFIPERLKQINNNKDVDNLDEKEVIEDISQIRIEGKSRPRKIYYSSKVSLAKVIYQYLQLDKSSLEEFDDIEFPIEEEDFIPESMKSIIDNIENEEIQQEEKQIQTQKGILNSFVEYEAKSDKGIITKKEQIQKVNPEKFIEKIEKLEKETNIKKSNRVSIQSNTVSIEKDNSIKTIVEDISKQVEKEDINLIPKIENPVSDKQQSEIQGIEEENIFESSDTDKDTFDLSMLDDIDGEEFLDDSDLDSGLKIDFNDDDEDEEEQTDDEDIENTVNKKVGLFQKLVGFNSKKKKEA